MSEWQTFDDIIIGDFYDTYENLPLKTYLGYQFYTDHCQNHAGLVQFIDDDTFVRFDEMEKILMDSEQVVCLKGFPIDNHAVSYVGKYYVWVDQWPSRYRVPKYCNGQCVGMSGVSARAIYKAAALTAPNDFRLEDMLFSGIIRKKAKLKEPVGLDATRWGQDHDRKAACLHTKVQTYDEMAKFIKRFRLGKLEMPRES